MFKPRYTRVRPPPEAPVRVQLEGPGLLEILHARDVSRSGVGLSLGDADPRATPDRDDEVELVIQLPGRSPFRARGEVRHTTEYLDEKFFGVELVEIAEVHRTTLESYVTERLRAERGLEPAAPRRAL